MTVGAVAIFALLGGFLTNRFGRKPIILLASVIFAIGAIVLSVAGTGMDIDGTKIMLLVGRFILGMAIGNQILYNWFGVYAFRG